MKHACNKILQRRDTIAINKAITWKEKQHSKALNCRRGSILLWSGFCLWESLQLFLNITHSCNSVFISYNRTTHTYKWLPFFTDTC